MAQHIFRVVVRGMFDGLDDDTRERLLRDAPDHDIFVSSYTRDGTFTYDERLVAFSFRFEVRLTDGEGTDFGDLAPDERTAAVCRVAEELAESSLRDRGLGFKRLRSNATDMAEMWR